MNRHRFPLWLVKRADRGRDDRGDRVRVGDQCQVRSAAEQGDVRVCTLGHRELRLGRDDLIAGADEVPGWNRLPSRRLRRCAERDRGCAALRRPQPLGLAPGEVIGEIVDEDVLLQVQLGRASGCVRVAGGEEQLGRGVLGQDRVGSAELAVGFAGRRGRTRRRRPAP